MLFSHKMENTKLIQILKTFSKTEFEDFGKFVFSPFFNNSEQITKFYIFLQRHYPGFNSSLTKENIYKEIYKDKDYKDKRVRDLLSRTLKLAEEFLAYSDIRNDEFLIKRKTLGQIALRNLDKHFEKKAGEIGSMLNSNIKNDEYILNNYLFAESKRDYLEYKKALGKRSEFFNEITGEIEKFIIYFIFRMLKYFSTLISQQLVMNKKYEFTFLYEIIGYLRKNPAKDYPVVMIFYYSVLLYIEPENEDIFFHLKDILAANTEIIEDKELRLIYTQMYNYSKEKQIHGSENFRRENFGIIKEMLSKNIYPMEAGYMPEHTYISITGEGLIFKEFEWTEKFMKDYREKLPPEKRENAFIYCSSVLNYRKKNYGGALRTLVKVSINDFYYHLRVKNHLLKIYYEQDDLETALSVIDSFRHFLSTNKLIPEYIRIRFVNFVNFFSRLVNARLNNENSNIIILKKDISAVNPSQLENGTWLLERIKELNI